MSITTRSSLQVCQRTLRAVGPRESKLGAACSLVDLSILVVHGAANRVAHFLAAAGVAPGTTLLDEQARAEVAQAPVVALARRLAGLLGRASLPLAPLAAQKVCPDVGGRRVRGRWSLDPDRFVLGALLVASTGSACALILAGISVVPLSIAAVAPAVIMRLVAFFPRRRGIDATDDIGARRRRGTEGKVRVGARAR